MLSRVTVSGRIQVQVLGPEGLRSYKQTLLRKLLRLPPRRMAVIHHNTITSQGVKLIADCMLEFPTRCKVTSSFGYMQVGTGWSKYDPQYTYRCHQPVGYMHAIDRNFPVTENEGETLHYRSTFEEGFLVAGGINEACLLNGSSDSADCLAYAQVDPAVTVTAADTLLIDWHITISGK